MASYSSSTVAEILKTLYPDTIEKTLVENSPILGLIKKRSDFEGAGEYLVWQISNAAGQSATFTNAQTNRSAPTLKRPLITRSKEYFNAELDGELMRASKTNNGALVEAVKLATDNGIDAIKRSLSIQAYGSGGGSRGRIGTVTQITDAETVTLITGSAKNFDIGMKLQFDDVDGTASVESNSATVIGRNISANTLTITSGSSTPSANDYIFREGDYGTVIKGLGAWVPKTAPASGDSFFGVDRSVAPDDMAGQRYAPASGNIEDVLMTAGDYIGAVGETPDVCFMNPLDWGTLAKRIEAKRTDDTVSAVLSNGRTTKVGYSAITVLTGGGAVKCVADPWCPQGQAWMGKLDTLEWWSAGPLVAIDDEDGKILMKTYNADSYEIRIKSYPQLVCKKPSAWIHITLP